MKKRRGMAIAVVFAVLLAGGCDFGSVSYEVVASLPEDSHAEELQRDRHNPVTIAVREEYIAVLPPYGYEIEFVDVVRDGGITMLYNLKKLENPNGEAPAFVVKVSNPRKGPIGATCQNLDSLAPGTAE